MISAPVTLFSLLKNASEAFRVLKPGGQFMVADIIANYLNMSEIWVLGVFLEVFLGRAQNLTNVLGDIVMVSIDDAKEKAKG